MNGTDFSRRRGFKATAFFYLIAGFIAIQALAFAPQARASWNLITSFAGVGSVSASWFFNPEVGLIGFSWQGASSFGMVKRTVDGGVTWTNCTVPALSDPSGAIVTDIWFATADSGWLTLHVGEASGDPSLWRTIDSGKTWNPVASYVGISPVSVRLTPNALIVADELSYGLQWSADTGKTWPYNKAIFKNGLSFDGEFNGVVSTNHGTQNLQTTDGGLNWAASPGSCNYEGWDSYCVQHAQVFLIVPEDTTYGVGANRYHGSRVFRSSDDGRDFNIVDSFTFRCNGAVRGVEGIIYVQEDSTLPSSTPGLWRSEDSGLTWKPVGGPCEEDDRRFSVTGCGNVVYAFDNYGGVWKTIDAGDGTVPGQCKFVDNDTLAPLETTICDTLNHLYYLHNINISTIVVEDLSIFDSTRSSTTGAVYFDSLPNDYESILPGDSLAFGLAWHPGALIDSTGTDSVTIRVIYYASYLAQFPESGLIPYDTLYFKVKLTGESTAPEFALSTKTIHTDTLIACNSVDTIVTVVNNSCDSLEITSATLLKGTWSLSVGSAAVPIKLPYYLQSKDTLQFRLQETPVSEAIVFDSLLVKMHYMGHDSSFGVGLRTNAKPGISLIAPQALDFDSVATCVSSSQIFSLQNSGCQPVIITQADLGGAYFTLLDTNGAPLPIPYTIPGDTSVRVMVKFTPGTLGAKSATLALHSQYFGYDSLHNVSLTGIGSASGTVAFPTTFNFNNVSICGSLDSTITISNKTCLKIFVDSLVVPAPFVSLDSALLPLAVDTGTSVQLRIRFKPESKQTESAQVYMKLDINDGATAVWDTLTFSGTGVAGASEIQTVPPLTATTLNFDTISECGRVDSISFKVFNPGCDTTIVTGLSLDAGISSTFAAHANQPLPAYLSGNDSITITVAILDLVANTYSGNLHLDYTLSDGSMHDLPAPLSLTVTAGGGASALSLLTPTILDFDTINGCYTTPDSAIILANTGCNNDTVNFGILGPGFVLGSGPTSIIIPEYQNDTIRVYYDGSSQGSLSSTVSVTSSAKTGSNFSVLLKGIVPPPSTVNFNVSFSQMPVSAGSIFNVYLTPDAKFNGSGPQALHEIKGELDCPENSFQYNGGAAALENSKVSVNENDLAGTSHFTFDITNNNPISLSTTVAALTLPLEAMITDTDGGIIWADSIALNTNDPSYGKCTLSANPKSPGLNTTISNQCGDSTLILTLQNKALFSYQRLQPNPVTQESGYKTILDLVSAEDGIADIELFDALGQVVSRGEISLTHGQAQEYTFDLHDLTSGSYYYSLLFNGQTTAGNLRGTLMLVK